ncbi:cellobiohydrolase, partial [Chrysochromulina tobinii]
LVFTGSKFGRNRRPSCGPSRPSPPSSDGSDCSRNPMLYKTVTAIAIATASAQKSCAQNCVLEGADEEYTDTYGVKASGDKLDLQFVTQGPYSKNVGSRTYLMNDEHK